MDAFGGIENETRLFLLLRVIFDLPHCSHVSKRRTFKGWYNWPEPDQNYSVNLSWPIKWKQGKPALAAHFVGANGHRYAAVDEFNFLLQNYPLRRLELIEHNT